MACLGCVDVAGEAFWRLAHLDLAAPRVRASSLER
jgi:hypothetical protein